MRVALNLCKPYNTAFKADVRVDYSELTKFPEEHQRLIKPVLEHAETAYKDLGSDNILLSIKPLSTDDKRIKDRFYSIAITQTYKDTERARKEIIEANDRDFPNDGDEDVIALKNKTPDIMSRLKLQEQTCLQFTPLRLLPQELKRRLDDMMPSVVKSMTYGVPEEKKPNTYNAISNYDRW